MKQLFLVRVEVPTCNPNDPFKKVFEKQISFDSSIQYPYSSILDSMKFLFGSNCLVSFLVQ